MSIATEPWTDHNRFNQTGYSAATLFPKEEDYTNKMLYLEDLEKAEAREVWHQEFLDDLREEARMEAYYEQCDMDDEFECLDDDDCDDEQVNEGWV